MQQVVQNLRSGKTELKTVPTPACGANELLVATRASLISAGTERMVMDFANKSLVGKAKERPDLTAKVVAKIGRDGLVDTLSSVFARLSEPMPLGYSAAGVVVQVGTNLGNEFKVGQSVAIAGAGQANHAEYNAVPRNLCVPVPAHVPSSSACYATLAAIALHGVRNAGVNLGDRVLVVGLGLVGQLAVQLCAAAGARVAGLDPQPDRCMLAKQGGAQWATGPAGIAQGYAEFTDGRGFDSILICAATDSDGPLEQAADWARDRATVILVGKVGTRFPYAAYMKKELTVRVSRSYGPGRYDPAYEQQGLAYPVGFVPHTERDNLAEVVRLMGTGQLKPQLLTTHTFEFEKALQGYDLIQSGQPSLGVVLSYPESPSPLAVHTQPQPPTSVVQGQLGLSFIGVGGFARSVMLPALKSIKNISLRGVVSKGGLSAAHVAEKYRAAYASTNLTQVMSDPATNAVIIATRHNAHASQTIAALQAKKHVWIEKPLALTLSEIDHIATVAAKAGRILMVGFNRRFSPALVPLQAKLQTVSGPRQVLIRVNAGRLEVGGWQHAAEGGGRLLGEVCHFTDLALWLINQPLTQVQATQAPGQDNYVIQLTFQGGSTATIVYTSEGDPAAAKERVEVFGGGAVGIMDNYTRTTWSQHGRRQTLYRKRWWQGQQKGHAQGLRAWLTACAGQGTSQLPSVSELIFSSRVPLWAATSIARSAPVTVE